MIKYGFKNIRDLFGHKIDLNLTRTHPIVRWDVDEKKAKWRVIRRRVRRPVDVTTTI